MIDQSNEIESSSPRLVALLLLTSAHVLLEGFALVDGLASILILVGGDFAGVILTAHGPAELGGGVPVGLLVVEGGGRAERRGGGEGGSRSDEGGKDGGELVLS